MELDPQQSRHVHVTRKGKFCESFVKLYYQNGESATAALRSFLHRNGIEWVKVL